MRHDRDRLELGRVEVELLVEEDIGGDRRGLRGHQRIAVGLGTIDGFGAEIAAGAAAVLDHDRLPEPACSFSAKMRVTVSTPPPAGTETMILIGALGEASCAWPGVAGGE